MSTKENNTEMKSEYRSAPDRMPAAQDPGAIRRFDLKNDKVSVVHSGESDPMPNQEAQEAFADRVDDTSGLLGDDENDYEEQQGLAENAGPEERVA